MPRERDARPFQVKSNRISARCAQAISGSTVKNLATRRSDILRLITLLLTCCCVLYQAPDLTS